MHVCAFDIPELFFSEIFSSSKTLEHRTPIYIDLGRKAASWNPSFKYPMKCLVKNLNWKQHTVLDVRGNNYLLQWAWFFPVMSKLLSALFIVTLNLFLAFFKCSYFLKINIMSVFLGSNSAYSILKPCVLHALLKQITHAEASRSQESIPQLPSRDTDKLCQADKCPP